jgi:hypothetical protein
MSKVKVALLSIVVAGALGAVTATVAAAFPGPFYYVEKAKVGGSGASKAVNIAIKPGTTVKLLTEYSNFAVEAVCKAVKAEGAVFYNATFQGESEMTKLTFSECTVIKPSICKIVGGTFSTVGVYSYLDYEKNPEPTRTPITQYFRPKSGSVFAEVPLEGRFCLAPSVLKVKGTAVANVSPERKEAKEAELTFPNPPITRTWDTVAGNKFAEYSAGMELEGKPAILVGTVIATMTTGEKFGAFDE